MAELVDANDSKSFGANHAGSSPALGTIYINKALIGLLLYLGTDREQGAFYVDDIINNYKKYSYSKGESIDSKGRQLKSNVS